MKDSIKDYKPLDSFNRTMNDSIKDYKPLDSFNRTMNDSLKDYIPKTIGLNFDDFSK
jgi:hypothetical protein